MLFLQTIKQNFVKRNQKFLSKDKNWEAKTDVPKDIQSFPMILINKKLMRKANFRSSLIKLQQGLGSELV